MSDFMIEHRDSSLKKENKISRLLKTKRRSFKLPRYSKSPGSSKWRTNNLQLARENARLRKDIQKCITALNESAVRYENLEVAWRRRGETLSKVDIISRLVGNQISKLVDTLTELRTACQVELSTPLHEVPVLSERLDRISHLRHSMPMAIRTNKSTLQMPSRSQLVNHVNPMVSGHPIIKPTITLQRLNLRNVPSNVPGEQIQVRSRILNEVQIPLERLSLSQIAESIGSPVNRNSMSQLEAQEDSSIFTSSEMPSHISMDSILEESPRTCNPRNSSRALNSDWPAISLDERSSVSNQHSNNSGRKYSTISRVRTPTSGEQRNRMNADIEKCCLVVALKDVGSYLHNGTLTNVELLEERKVKTGASAHPHLKVENNVNDDPELNISSASGDQIEVDFTTDIEAMDYGAVPLQNDDNEKENSFSATQEFLNRIRNEDPLEGPSWRFENVTTREVRKRQKPLSLNLSASAKKNKEEDCSISDNRPIPKKASSLDLDLCKLRESTDKHLECESETLFNNAYIDKMEMDFTEHMDPCEAKLKIMPSTNTSTGNAIEKKTELDLSQISIEPKDCLESSPAISSYVKPIEKEVNLSLVKTECSSELENNCKPNSPKRLRNKGNNDSTNIGLAQHQRSRKQKENQTKKRVPNSHSVKGKGKKKRVVKISKKDIKTESEVMGDQVLEARSGNMHEERSHLRRTAAPKCLKEPHFGYKCRE